MRQYVAKPSPRRECKNQLIIGANGGCPKFLDWKSLNSGMDIDADKPDVSFEYR